LQEKALPAQGNAKVQFLSLLCPQFTAVKFIYLVGGSWKSVI